VPNVWISAVWISALAMQGSQTIAEQSARRSSQVRRHHKFGVATLDDTVVIKHLNGSTTARYVFNQPGVVRAIPGVTFGLKGTAYSVAIPEYGVAHDALLPGATSSI
jgi:hypothetical protein